MNKLKSNLVILYFFPFNLLFSCHFHIVTSSGDPRNIEEYVPTAIPIIKASEKCCVDSPPTKYSTIRANRVVREVFIDLVNV